MSNLTQELIEDDGYINPRNLANTFGTTVKTLASISSLSVDAISKTKRAHSNKSQERLREVLLIINRVTPLVRFCISGIRLVSLRTTTQLW
jgi:hypothetical protein